jgi:hypothetical protein
MANITAKVTPQGNTLKSRVNPQQKLQVTEYRVDTSNLRLGDLFDVNTSGATDGAVLVYSGNTVSFEATTEIKNPNTQVNGGHY